MKKSLFSLILPLLFLTSIGLFKPQSVLAADGGPAGKFNLRAASGPNTGEVTLTWSNNDTADNYHLVYGTDSKNMQYGVLNIGTNKVYTVKMLNPGTRYYFALVPVLNHVALYTSEWVSGVSLSAGIMVTSSVVEETPVINQPVTMQPVTPVVMTQPTATSGPVGKHLLWAKAGPNAGEVTLYWRHADDANNYHLVYGTESGKYKYGVLNIGWVNGFTVRSLIPGVTYYFALVPVKNDVALYTTNQVTKAAKMNVEVVQTTADALTQQPEKPVAGSDATNITPGGSTVPSTDSATPTTPAGN